MQIETLTISNFRGFRDEREISLDATVVIVRGPNGSGKTSMIDALQWLLLGDVQRLSGSVLKKGEDYISNRYATGPPFVEAKLGDNEESIRVSRRGIGNSMQVQVDLATGRLVGDSAQRWLNEAMSADDGGKHVELLRRYLLQQDDMREFLGADTSDRYEFVAALTGMEQLTSLDSQMTDELAQLRKLVRDLETKVKEGEGELEGAKLASSNAREMLDRRAERSVELPDVASRARDELGPAGKAVDGDAELLDSLKDRSVAIEVQIEQLAELQRRELRAGNRLEETPKQDPEQLSALKIEIDRLLSVEQQQRDHLARVAQSLEEARARSGRAQQLAALALEQIDGPCPVCGQEHDLDSTRQHLNQMLTEAPALAELTREAEEQRSHLAETQAERANHESELNRLNAAVEQRSQAEDLLEQVLDLRKIARQQLSTLVAPEVGSVLEPDLISESESLKQRLDVTARDLQRVLDAELQTQQATRKVETLDQQAVGRGEHLTGLQAELTATRERTRRAEKARRLLGKQLIEVMGNVANSSTPLINEIYRRLDVHPTFREFRFNTERHRESGHLRPWVYDRRRSEDGNALTVLSAAQLNALAICLFLALNLEGETPLKTAILDDPVQSLDDVNLLSLSDVLQTVRGRRQVIVSTHDETLAELLMRKLRPLRSADSTMVVTLDRWGEAGPRVSYEKRQSPTLEPELELLRDASA